MITNQRQYNLTRTQAKKFADAIKGAVQNTPAGVHPRVHEAMIDGLRSQHDELTDDLHAYEALRAGKVRRRTISSLADLPTVLIEGRIAKQMTQKRLAEKLDLPEQQIQRYEANRYAGASLERLQEIATAIGLKLRKAIEFELAEPALTTGGHAGGGARSGRRRSAGSGTFRVARTAAKKSSSTVTAKRKPETTAKRAAKGAASPAAQKTGTKAKKKSGTAAKKSSAKATSKKTVSQSKRSATKASSRADRSSSGRSRGSRR